VNPWEQLARAAKGKRCGQCQGCLWDGPCAVRTANTRDPLTADPTTGNALWRKDPDGTWTELTSVGTER